MNVIDFIIVALILTLMGLIIIRIFKKRKLGGSGCSSCRGCPGKKYCTKNKK